MEQNNNNQYIGRGEDRKKKAILTSFKRPKWPMRPRGGTNKLIIEIKCNKKRTKIRIANNNYQDYHVDSA